MTSPSLYTPLLCTLPYVRLNRKMATDETADDAMLLDLIRDRSAEFAEMVGRGPLMPYVATRSFDREYWRGLDIRMPDDLLEISTLLNADGSTISTGYTLRPANYYPKNEIRLTQAGGLTWQFVNLQDAVSVAGVWGYAPHYPTCWKQITTLGAELTDSATSVTLTSGTSAEVGGYLFIGSEQMLVLTKSTNTLTVERGVNGTTPAAHINTAAVKVYQQLRDICAAVRELVVYDYLRKGEIGRVQVFQGGTVEVNDIDPSVGKTAKAHARRYTIEAI